MFYYKNKLKILYINAANNPEIGIVNTQAQIKFTVTPHRTAEIRLVIPTPIIDPVIVCVVETGILKCSVINKVKAPADSATTPSKAVTFVILEPIVLTIFHRH